MLLRKSAILLLPLLYAHAAVPKELQSLADQARNLPPEFAADVLLKLAASPLANDPKWKRGLIEDAFLSAAHAQSPYRKLGDNRVSLDAVLSLHLEALTLQTGAVEAMLALDPPRAVTMFQDIPAPELPKLSCQQALTPDVSAYYQTAINIFTSAFTPEQRGKEEDIQFLRARIAAVQSPSQVVPALKLLDQVELSPRTRAELVALFAIALDRIHGGDREFAASEALLMGAAVPEMHETAFLSTLRAYIVRHLSGPRCSDQMKGGQLPESAAQFNKLISRIDVTGSQFHPIAADEAAPLRDDGTYPPPAADQSTHGKQVRAAVHALQNDDPSTKEWTEHYYAALKLMESWSTQEEASPEDAAFTLATEYFVLLREFPNGAAQMSAAGSFLHFLEQQYDPAGNRSLWFLEFHLLLNRARSSNGDSDQAWLLDQLLHSRNPVIATYAQVEKLLGQS
jgi:hypothetical protein